MKNLSNWRAVRLWESGVERDLRERHALWLSAAVRLTWKPLAGAMLCAVLLGAAIDYFLPQAHSLPHAIRLIRS